MPPAVAAPQADADANANAQGQGQQRRRGGFLQAVIRMALMWYMMKQFSGSRTKPGDAQQPKSGLAPALSPGALVDVHVFVSEHSEWRLSAGQDSPVWVASDVPLARVDKAIEKTYYYSPSPSVQNNGTVYVHAIFTPPGGSPNPKDDDFDGALSWGRTNSLNVYLPKRKAGQGVNLLSGKNATDDQPLPDDTTTSNETVIISYLKPNVTISFVDEFRTFQSNSIPPPFVPFLEEGAGGGSGKYHPMVWFNDFWLLRDYLVPVNDTLVEVPIHLAIDTIGSFKYSVFSQMEVSFSLQQSWGMSSSSETDEIKRIFLEGNPYFLGLTILVSLLHSLFDILAFKNDIGFWRDNKSMRGLSARTIIINAVCQLIIFLYLLDNETSFVVLMSSGVGTAIEFWKVTKAMDVKLDMSGGGFLGLGLPRLRFKDRESYTSSKTDQYDAEAMRYLAYALYPLVGGYAVYSLLYQTHKSWYSWILNSLVGAVYTFGFILMCPQLYLNYKLKSVAHLPWRQMTYKFLNTIIDDLFAFVIKMPLLHRLSVFRDDLVFLVYLYQRWIYRVDKTRANEFGYAEEEAVEERVPQGSEQGPEEKTENEESKKEK